MKFAILATVFAMTLCGQWDVTSDATKLEAVVLASSTPPVISPLAPQPAVSRKAMNIWYASQYSLIAANALDVHSSWGKYELNPVLKGSDGKFGAKGLLIKAAFCGGFLAYEHIVYRKILKTDHDKRKFIKAATISNFIMTGLFTGIAARNYTIPKPEDAR